MADFIKVFAAPAHDFAQEGAGYHHFQLLAQSGSLLVQNRQVPILTDQTIDPCMDRRLGRQYIRWVTHEIDVMNNLLSGWIRNYLIPTGLHKLIKLVTVGREARLDIHTRLLNNIIAQHQVEIASQVMLKDFIRPAWPHAKTIRILASTISRSSGWI